MKRHLGKLIAFLCGGVLLIISVVYQGPVSGGREWLRVFSNAALVPGILLTGLGLILRISEEGLFDGVRYAVTSLFAHLRGVEKQYSTYYDYIHRERKKSAASHILVPGLVYLALAVGLTLLYYC